MNCRSAEDLFSSYVEDELSQSERRTLEGHLTECRRCSEAVEEVRATVTLMSALPSYETGPAFEEEIMDRIRSGEALRPSLVEWLSERIRPLRLRPLFLAGAAGCALWIAFLMANPSQHLSPGSGSNIAQTPPASSPAAPNGSTDGTAPSVVAPTPTAPAEEVIATAPPASDRSASRAPAVSGGAASGTADSALAKDAAPYQDEYILDQFYLNRSGEDGVHSIVPVSGRTTDDVYITF